MHFLNKIVIFQSKLPFVLGVISEFYKCNLEHVDVNSWLLIVGSCLLAVKLLVISCLLLMFGYGLAIVRVTVVDCWLR